MPDRKAALPPGWPAAKQQRVEGRTVKLLDRIVDREVGARPPNHPQIPAVVDATHATRQAAAFLRSFFMAKSRHDVDATMSQFSTSRLAYIDATLG